MLNQISGYIPLAALIIVGVFLGFIVWRGNYKLGAYVVQVVAAFFLSSVAGFSLYILSSVMVTTWLFAGSSSFLMINAVLMQAIGGTVGFAIVKRFGTHENLVTPKELAIAFVLGIIGGYVGFILFKDATFAADFVTNANAVSGAYFGAVLMANSPLIVGGLVRVLQNHEP